MVKKTYTPQEAKSRYESLPAEIKSLLYSPEMLMSVRQIAQKHQLHIDQTGILEDETSAVMLGFTDTIDYPAVLAETMDIDTAKAGAVAQDVNDLLFTKIRDAMKQTYEKQRASSVTVSATTTAVKITTPLPPTTAPTPKPMEAHPADLMLTQKTVSVAPATQLGASSLEGKGAPIPAAKTDPPKPQPYKADPYREPTN